jgi:transcription elongation GreA/GreB family factor
MSRAFVKESDHDHEPLPERPVSGHTNFVTHEGLRQIEAQIRDLDAQRQMARAGDDASSVARLDRDLRYWTKRRATARVVEPAASPDAVRFGVRVTLMLGSGEERTFRLVGEDEADPARGLVSWISPLAQALLGQARGDTVQFQGSEAQIVRIEP